MLLAAICCTVLAPQQTPKQGPAGPTSLTVYQEHKVFLNGLQGASKGDIQGQSLRYDRIGTCTWEVSDGGSQGIPCKVYDGSGEWNYEISKKNSAIKNHHVAQFTMQYFVGLDGMPIHSVSHFTDVSEDDSNIVDIIANYKSDHIDEKITKNGQSESVSMYPTFGMERFAGMFEPLMRSGLIQHDHMDCAVIHPCTGTPYEFTLQVHSRFTGTYFFLPQAGYCIDIDGAEGTGRAFLTRQGQLLQVNLPDHMSADLEEGYLADERNGWGNFSVMDWDKSTDETNPERPQYHTLAIPILFKDDHVLFPVPCALTD